MNGCTPAPRHLSAQFASRGPPRDEYLGRPAPRGPPRDRYGYDQDRYGYDRRDRPDNRWDDRREDRDRGVRYGGRDDRCVSCGSCSAMTAGGNGQLIGLLPCALVKFSRVWASIRCMHEL